MYRHKFIFGIKLGVFVLVALFVASASWATTYYINNTGGDDGNSGKTLSSPWKTISKANSTLSAGDIVWIKGGTYKETIKPARNGENGQEIIYASYRPGEDLTKVNFEEVIITGVAVGVNLIEKSYIKVDGLKILDTSGEWVDMRPNGCHNTIQNCYMEEASGTYKGIQIRDDANYNKIINNTLIGYCGPSDLIQIWDSSYNLFEGNKVYYGKHTAVSIQERTEGKGRYNVIRNNYVQNKWNHAISLAGPEYVLIENNIVVDAGDDGPNSPCGTDRAIKFERNERKGISIGARWCITRKNVVVNNGYNGLIGTTDWIGACKNVMMYNNTLYKNYHGIRSNASMPITENVIKNNILYNQHEYEILITADISTNYYINNNVLGSSIKYHPNDIVNATLSSNPLFVDGDGNHTDSIMRIPGSFLQANEPFNFEFNPIAIKVDRRDLRLQTDSKMINSGAFLTKTVSSGSNSKVIGVEDARYFMDGWGIVDGDVIQLQGQTQTARITSIDYNSNTITVDTLLSWGQGDGLSLHYKGSAPDIGAYESESEDSGLVAPTNLRILE